MSDTPGALPPLPRIPLTPRQWATFAAHGFKASAQQHHGDLAVPFGPLIPQDAVIFDVGAHAGQYAKLLARLAPQGTVYAFEPGRYTRAVLMLAMALNRAANVRVFPVALGAARATLELRTPVKRSGSYGFGLAHIGQDATTTRRETVEAIDIVTMDAFCAFMDIRRLDFIKADIEGWELQMLKGGEDALQRFRPCLWLEVVDASLARAGDSVAALWSFMSARGFTPYRIDDAGRISPTVQGEGDILWVPQERVGALPVLGG